MELPAGWIYLLTKAIYMSDRTCCTRSMQYRLLIIDCAAAEMGILNRSDTEERAMQTLTTIKNHWCVCLCVWLVTHHMTELWFLIVVSIQS